MKKKKDLGINEMAKKTMYTIQQENIKTLNALKKLGYSYGNKRKWK